MSRRRTIRASSCDFVNESLRDGSAMLMRGKSPAHLDRRGYNHDLTQWLGPAIVNGASRGKSLAHLDRGRDNHDLTQWLGHADARQVCDLPTSGTGISIGL
jgi:hypothetical protein